MYAGYAPSSAPANGAIVAFQDLDGTSRSTTTDEAGHASGEVEPGGTVWLAQSTGPPDPAFGGVGTSIAVSR